jgi:Transglutaminase-like superfamily
MLCSAGVMVPSSLFLWQKRCLLGVSVFIGLVSISCFGESAFFPVQSTPYDRQMTRVYPALNSMTGKSQGSISLDAVNEWMTELRAMPYHFSPYWQTPTEVNFNQTADCKGKAVALYALMRRYGAKSVRVVIGRRHIYDSNTHAWLEWATSQGSYTLDPTFNEMPVRTAELDPMTYVASYAFDGEHKYRATSSLIASNTRVATGYNDHLYVPTRAASSYVSGGGTSTFGQPTFTAFGAPQFSPPSTNYSAPNPQYRTQYQKTVTPASWSQVQNSPPYLARPVPAASPVVRSTPVSLSPVYPRPIVHQAPTLIQTQRLTTRTRLTAVQSGQRITHSISSGTPYHRHIRHVAQHRKHLTQPKRLASQS